MFSKSNLLKMSNYVELIRKFWHKDALGDKGLRSSLLLWTINNILWNLLKIYNFILDLVSQNQNFINILQVIGVMFKFKKQSLI